MKKSFLFSFGLIAAFALLFVSCDEDSPEMGTSECNVSLSVNGDGEAYFENYYASSIAVEYGTEVTAVAYPYDGNYFAGWYEGGIQVSTDQYYVFTVYGNRNLVAKFEEVNFEAVDLGLSVRWASFNVGATTPEEYGGYYAWGEIEEKESYNEEDYEEPPYYSTGSWSGELPADYDVAHVKWGGNWRMPTSGEQWELYNDCTWQWTTLNGVNGYTVTGPNGNNIFLPAAGYREGTAFINQNLYGSYWNSTWSSGALVYLGYLNFKASELTPSGSSLDYCGYYGRSVRPVCE